MAKSATDCDIERFEAEIGRILPTDYTKFLKTQNGEMGNNTFLDLDIENIEIGDIGTIFGLGVNQADDELSNRWKVWAYYDLAKYKEELKDYICFGTDDFGDLFLLNLDNQFVFYFTHERDVDSTGRVILTKIANSFSEFLAAAIDEDPIPWTGEDEKYWQETAKLRRIQNAKIQEEHRIRKLKKSSEL
ncbi:SMI1/KNR4 family protein [uncultured Tateyamaria sp.]|uniref:SMI1/KNR4 family protein n=1 Tax=uncultured Tateyamaria sp. TaxID=455651 RepID=UPI0026334ADE|nr:SMI1/KNR4 family protein [uncultured Tateyamaria sp.]